MCNVVWVSNFLSVNPAPKPKILYMAGVIDISISLSIKLSKCHTIGYMATHATILGRTVDGTFVIRQIHIKDVVLQFLTYVNFMLFSPCTYIAD